LIFQRCSELVKTPVVKPNSLICTQTREEYPLNEIRWKSDANALLDIRFIPHLDKSMIRPRSANLWRYRESLPLEDDKNIISFGEGATPLQKVQIDGKTVFLKLDFMFPTGSYKDRGASVMVSKIKELGIKKVVQDSSGNAGASVACYCAKAGIECDIYVPENTSKAKLAQIQMYGANLYKVKGSRQDTADVALKAAQNSYYASHCWNPFFLQGTKTFAYEVCEQLGWKAPDAIVLPAGNGTLLLGAYIGFRELFKMGLIDHIPKLIGVQAENCSPLFTAFVQGLPELPLIEPKETIAEGIAIANPIRGKQMIQYVELSEGTFLTVSEKEILETLFFLSKKGFFVEPTSAAVVAGLRKYLYQSAENELVISVLTGSGLKSTEKIIKILEDLEL
jgi:threonine synthase